ncbi:hypothetical protein [Streptomyces sp. NPDC058653]|uniref:hypothetical protein n=1 Tax=Streptomyces sp. NPDC058653 TaxID=3346576 RepID=UPI0036573216
MSARFRWLKQEFLVGKVWKGPELGAPFRQFQAGIGAGCSTLAQAAWATMGALSPQLMEFLLGQVEAMRATVEVESGIWTITLELHDQNVTFANTTTGELQTLSVHPEAGEQSAGSFTLGLMGIDAVETARGSVTLNSVMALLYLQQAHAGIKVYGDVKLQDLAVTIEICFGLLDEKVARLKGAATAAKSKATKAATALKKAMEQREADGLPTRIDLDAREIALAKAADAAHADLLRLAGELEIHFGVLTARANDTTLALQRAAAVAAETDRAHQALPSLYEARGQSRAALAAAEKAAEPRTHCDECAQPLAQRTGPGPLCVLCRQPDPGFDERTARKAAAVQTAKTALDAVERSLAAAQVAAQQAVDKRRKAQEAVHLASGRADAYRAAEVTPREQAKALAGAALAEAQTNIAAVRERRKELARIVELERLAQLGSEAAERAQEAWALAEGDAQHVRDQTAKALSVIFAEKVIPMAPDKIHEASIDPKTFLPKINGQSVRQLSRSHGLINIAQVGLHLTFLEAARFLPNWRLPATQWLDAPLDGVGGGPEGERLVAQALDVITSVVTDDAQIIIATPQELPATPGAEVTVHDSHHPVVPHPPTASDEA